VQCVFNDRDPSAPCDFCRRRGLQCGEKFRAGENRQGILLRSNSTFVAQLKTLEEAHQRVAWVSELGSVGCLKPSPDSSPLFDDTSLFDSPSTLSCPPNRTPEALPLFERHELFETGESGPPRSELSPNRMETSSLPSLSPSDVGLVRQEVTAILSSLFGPSTGSPSLIVSAVNDVLGVQTPEAPPPSLAEAFSFDDGWVKDYYTLPSSPKTSEQQRAETIYENNPEASQSLPHFEVESVHLSVCGLLT
jgi:hypothetical protein